MKTVKKNLVCIAIILVILVVTSKSFIVEMLISPFLLGLLYVLILNKNKTIFSKPLFNPDEKLFKRFCVGRVLLFVAVVLTFTVVKSLLDAAFDEKSGLFVAFAVLIECFVTYLIFANKNTIIFKNAKSVLITLAISIVVTVISGILFSKCMTTFYEVLSSHKDGSGNMMGITGMIAASDAAEKYRVAAYHVCLIQKWIIMGTLIIFHSKQVDVNNSNY